ncbi:hypothetical protein AV530_002448 [Patagioenas fasciata monilis]|uniref:Uncharacterized protein n=1 Tax=Patagioenas fasciata monilis TaxID=372326 RepID=A0A1V4K6L2_PATFA|nr:hypothetical protein AV530_002448 [Patagioenas fasciata monilis]
MISISSALGLSITEEQDLPNGRIHGADLASLQLWLSGSWQSSHHQFEYCNTFSACPSFTKPVLNQDLTPLDKDFVTVVGAIGQQKKDFFYSQSDINWENKLEFKRSGLFQVSFTAIKITGQPAWIYYSRVKKVPDKKQTLELELRQLTAQHLQKFAA